MPNALLLAFKVAKLYGLCSQLKYWEKLCYDAVCSVQLRLQLRYINVIYDIYCSCNIYIVIGCVER